MSSCKTGAPFDLPCSLGRHSIAPFANQIKIVEVDNARP